MSFFSMGGYAAYVWPSFGASIFILIFLFYGSWRVLKSREANLRSLENSSSIGDNMQSISTDEK
ncbi:MAG: heme exporter protein CcmD [Rhodospirillaceae bacterium]|nr:heme exporter protein CcmD [Rhodospirillaceae bacterium]|tara:strand:- start:2676 stop:2867 length:192 start_codon:yes stop_codon:yes gene_type:complete